MGTYYKAVVVIGLPRQQLLEKFEDLDEILDNTSLEIVAPIYDGYNDEYAIIGYVIAQSEDYAASILSFSQDMGTKFRKFKEITGLEPKIWLSPQYTQYT